MRLTLEQTLHRLGRNLTERIAPDVTNDFVAQSARMAAGTLNICANWVDDAAAIRVSENAAIREVLGEAAGPAGGELGARLEAAAQSHDPGLKISELDEESHRLRLLLVEAQSWLEEQDSDDARALCQNIWRLLEDIEMTRAPRE